MTSPDISPNGNTSPQIADPAILNVLTTPNPHKVKPLPISENTILNERNFNLLNRIAKTTTYPREEVIITHVHIGPGNFFKSLIAPLSDEAIERKYTANDPNWRTGGICIVSVPKNSASSKTKEQTSTDESTTPPKGNITNLRNQDFLYCHNTRRPTGGETYNVIRSIIDGLSLERQPAQTLQQLCDPNVNLVTLTITSKGYEVDPECIANPTSPKSALGLLVRAIEIRRELGLEPFVIMSCDNMPPNGQRTKAQMQLYCAQAGKHELMEYIHQSVRFPITGVDSITPATTWSEVSHTHRAIGLVDYCTVASESWRRLVIQTKNSRGMSTFKDGVPWEGLPGVILTENCQPYAEMKAHIVNLSHMIIAWLGTRMNATHVHDVLTDFNPKLFLKRLLTYEVKPHVPESVEYNIDEEINRTIERFNNPHLPDPISRLNKEGSKKIPERVLKVVEKGLEKGTKIDGLCLVAACWLTSLFETNENGDAIPTPEDTDAFKAKVAEIRRTHNTPLSALPSFLQLSEVFDGLQDNLEFVRSMIHSLQHLEKGERISDIMLKYIKGEYPEQQIVH